MESYIGSSNTGTTAKPLDAKPVMVPSDPMETMAMVVGLDGAMHFLVAFAIEIGVWKDQHHAM